MHTLARFTAILIFLRPVSAPQFSSASLMAHAAGAADGYSTAQFVRQRVGYESWSAWAMGRRPGPARAMLTTQPGSWMTDIVSRTRWGARHERLVRAAYWLESIDSAAGTYRNLEVLSGPTPRLM